MAFESKQLLKMLEQSADSVMITDADGVIEYVNPAYSKLKNSPQEALLGEKGSFTPQMRQYLGKGEPFQEIRVSRWKDETPYYEELTITPIVGDDGKITHFISRGRDITKQVQAQEKLYRLAYYDLLTQLPNRALFLDRFKHAVAGMRNGMKRLGLLFLDLARFKNVNDTLGHDVGDKLLVAYAARLVECLREVDTIARISGDEFIVLLEGMPSLDDLHPICIKILTILSRPFLIEGHELFVTTSIGVSIYPQDGGNLSELMKCADIAMYRAKKAGRNTYRLYTPEMRKTFKEAHQYSSRSKYNKESTRDMKHMGS